MFSRDLRSRSRIRRSRTTTRPGTRLAALALGAALLSALLPGASPAQEEGRPFARFPDVSPDGSTVAFSWQGDIWTVPVDGGEARRLTVHEAYESHPRFDPGGARIAYESDRWGSDEIYVVGIDGTAPRRITHHSASDGLPSWTPEGELIFETRRTWVQVEREAEFYRVSSRGGTPDRMSDLLGRMPVLSPDGRFLAFTFGSNGGDRKGYRGPADKDIWLYDTASGEISQLTDFEGNDLHPRWAGPRSLFFVSERTGEYNLFRVGVADDGSRTGAPEELTGWTDDGVRTFGVGAGGEVAVVERRTDLYVVRPGSGEPTLLRIGVPDDERFVEVERRTYRDEAREYAVSPDGEHVAFVVRGEIFLTANDDEESRTVRLTRHPWRDRDVAWLDAETLVFASDREGQYDLYRLESADPEEPDLFWTLKRRAVRLTDTPEDERDPVVSPDGELVAYDRGRGELVVAAVDEGELGSERVLLDGWAGASGVAWSPDSKWLAYSQPDLDFNHEIYILAADGSRDPVNVTQHPKRDGQAVWSRDGRKLGFVSDRNNGDADVWFVWLREEDWERTRQDWEELEARPKEEEKAEEAEGEEEAADEPEPVRIDFEGIWERLEQVTSLPGNESDVAISEDGETFYFVNNRDDRRSFDAEEDLHSVKWDGTEMKAMTSGGASPRGVALGPGGKHLFMMRPGGRLARISAGEGNGRLETIPFAARMDIRFPEEKEQIFAEAWRVLDAGFYDPDFHGNDWEALRAKYEPWAMRASTRSDFRDVFNMMLGELNASHLGLYGSDRAERERERTGLLGVEIDPVEGGVRVERVVPRSPAARETSRLEVGDVITAVDGTPVSAVDNFYRLLVDLPGEKTYLTVRGSDGEEREVVIRPTGSLYRPLYEEWVRERKRLTEEYSDGRLGYIHIQGMNWPSFERFERELVAAGEGKDGLVIDVRFNGGGWTTDYLMAVLTVRQHAYTIPRGAADDLEEEHTAFREHYPYGERLPLASWTRPSIALCNRNSFSNAEIFSHAYKHLDIGTLVGEPTFGAVISTGGAGLIDGSFVRLPYRGWYVKATDENMELGPAVPDVTVWMDPAYRAEGEDAQLRAAVETLLGEIDGGGM